MTVTLNSSVLVWEHVHLICWSGFNFWLVSLGNGSAGCSGAEPDPVQRSRKLFSGHFGQQSHTPTVPRDACQPHHLQGMRQHQWETGEMRECVCEFTSLFYSSLIRFSSHLTLIHLTSLRRTFWTWQCPCGVWVDWRRRFGTCLWRKSSLRVKTSIAAANVTSWSGLLRSVTTFIACLCFFIPGHVHWRLKIEFAEMSNIVLNSKHLS